MLEPNNGYDGAQDPMPYLVEWDTDMEYRLVKAKDNPNVYRLKDGKKDLFINAESFTAIDGRWSKIEQVTQSELDAIPDGGVLIAVSNE